MIPTLRTPRLEMRALREQDLDAYAAAMGDPEVGRYLEGRPYDRAESWRSLALHLGHWDLRGYGYWALELRESGEFLGRAGLWNPEGWPGLEVGWTLGRAHWGRGYATEAGAEALRWAFRELGAEQVLSVIHPDNAGSIRVAERLGMRFERDGDVRGQAVRIYATSEPPVATAR